MATDEDKHLPTYDNTKLMNINTCPTWGIIRYSKHLKMPGSQRAMPLEAGAAAHEGFAAMRWMHLMLKHTDDKVGKMIAENAGVNIFGGERFGKMLDTINGGASDRTNCINFVLEGLYTSGFYDDPSDRNRTVSNISESLIAYIDRYDMDRYPLWIRDVTDPNSDVGIEIAFDIVVTFSVENEEYECDTDIHEYRFTGKLDGLHWNRDKLCIIEEKTAGNIGDAWLAQWVMANQITGYCVAAATFTGEPCMDAIVSGTKLPLPKVVSEGIRKEVVTRNELMFRNWAHWFYTTVQLERAYIDNVVKAPKYTHSCSRYFRACSFIPFCASESEEDQLGILDEMQLDEWSPLDE